MMRAEDLELSPILEVRRLRRALRGIHAIYEIVIIALVLTSLFLWFRFHYSVKLISSSVDAQTKAFEAQHQERMNYMKKIHEKIDKKEK